MPPRPHLGLETVAGSVLHSITGLKVDILTGRLSGLVPRLLVLCAPRGMLDIHPPDAGHVSNKRETNLQGIREEKNTEID